MEREWPEEVVGTYYNSGWLTRRVSAPVTAAHLAAGIPGSPTMCAVALALIDAGFMEPHIEHGKMTIKGIDGEAFSDPASLGLDAALIEKIMAFDRREPVEPFKLTIGCYQV